MEAYGFEGAGGFAQLKVELTHKMSDPQVRLFAIMSFSAEPWHDPRH